jgi:hypothetical protein
MDGADLYRELTFQAVMVMDWAQTRQIAKQPDRHEYNPILGRRPTIGRVNTYFVAAGIGHWAISEALPKDWRKHWQLVTIALEAGTVYHNYQIGLEIKW